MAGGGGTGWEADTRAVRRIRADPGAQVGTSRWPGTVPAVAQFLRDGLELSAGLTVLVGENGSGKSTVMEIWPRRAGLTRRVVGSGPAVPCPGQ